MRCFGARLTGPEASALALRFFGSMVFRAVDLVAVLRAGDFFCAAMRAAARDFGLCLAIPCLPYSGRAPRCGKRRARHVSRSSATRQRTLRRAARAGGVALMQPEHAVDRAQFGWFDQLGVGNGDCVKRTLKL